MLGHLWARACLKLLVIDGGKKNSDLPSTKQTEDLPFFSTLVPHFVPHTPTNTRTGHWRRPVSPMSLSILSFSLCETKFQNKNNQCSQSEMSFVRKPHNLDENSSFWHLCWNNSCPSWTPAKYIDTYPRQEQIPSLFALMKSLLLPNPSGPCKMYLFKPLAFSKYWYPDATAMLISQLQLGSHKHRMTVERIWKGASFICSKESYISRKSKIYSKLLWWLFLVTVWLTFTAAKVKKKFQWTPYSETCCW